jgi:hypothetical protein
MKKPGYFAATGTRTHQSKLEKNMFLWYPAFLKFAFEMQ